MQNNPLLSAEELPQFSNIEAKHVVPAIETTLKEARSKISDLEKKAQNATWDNFAQPLEDIEETLDRIWAAVSHLNSVKDSPDFRVAYQTSLETLTKFHTEVGQNLTLFQGYKTIAGHESFEQLSPARKRIVNNTVRDFRLSGAELDAEHKERFKEIALQLSNVSTQFEQNVLDATQSWHILISDERKLSGLPKHAIQLAEQAAHKKDQQGWRFTLDIPSYLAVMKYADDAKLRQSIYAAYCTRASEIEPNANQFDNGPLITQIVQLRHEKAQLLGFNNYAELALVTKMANDAEQVLSFLNELTSYAKPKAEQELLELQNFALEKHGIKTLQPWDYSYYSEKLRQHQFSFDSEEVKPYFPANTVIDGLFNVAQRLFKITIRPNKTIDTWDDSVLTFDVFDKDKQLIGQFYADLYVRANKRGGAWMGACRHRQIKPTSSKSVQLPVAYLTCNFAPPSGNSPALLTHDEVETLFHEFGHTLHHLLTTVDEMSVAGINGVAWDAVELPSQFLENWCWHADSIAMISGHYQTGESLPDALLQKMLRAKHFQTGMQTVRQIEFALFDMLLHKEPSTSDSNNYVQDLLNQVRQQVSVIDVPEYNRFQNSFSHIFAGGYAAGYYSYKWSEVLSADAFSRFEEEGIFNAETGNSFLSNILQRGGIEDPAVLFYNFRGREPSIQALLRQTGLTTAQ
ncbi:MAG: M3 family metallopeptidase [Arenicella sp.]